MKGAQRTMVEAAILELDKRLTKFEEETRQVALELDARLRHLEKSAAIAYLDANMSYKRYDELAGVVVKALMAKKHFRLTYVTVPNSGGLSVHGTIQIVEE